MHFFVIHCFKYVQKNEDDVEEEEQAYTVQSLQFNTFTNRCYDEW